MADLYLDHDVSHELVPLLVAASHTAHTADALGLAEATDGEHLLVAQQHRWILVTHNWHDFRLLHDAWRRWFSAHWRDSSGPTPSHSGILVIPQQNRPRHYWLPDYAAREITTLLNAGTDLANTLHRWRSDRGWLRY